MVGSGNSGRLSGGILGKGDLGWLTELRYGKKKKKQGVTKRRGELWGLSQ
jgi:hypothetical protein